MKIIKCILFLALLSLTTSFTSEPESLCDSFNGDHEISLLGNGGMWKRGNPKDFKRGIKKEQYYSSIERVKKVYKPIIENMGLTLEMEDLWTSGHSNAFASRKGNILKVAMFGGMARFRGMTELGFVAIICHEIGHHLGGAPKSLRRKYKTFSVEGQADYFATSRCMRKIYSAEENIDFLSKISEYKLNPLAKNKCDLAFETKFDRANCYRSSIAAYDLANVLKMMSNSDREFSFDTPDTKVVTKVYPKHTNPQCRLDTYFQASLCDISSEEPLSDIDANVGSCNRQTHLSDVTRPLCWYKPSVAAVKN